MFQKNLWLFLQGVNKFMISQNPKIVPSSANYLINFFTKLGYTLEVHEDWAGLTTLLTNTKDYPYEMDESFTPERMDGVQGFALYLKKDDQVIGTYAAKHNIPSGLRDGMIRLYPNLQTAPLPEILTRNDIKYYYSSCQWIHSQHLGKGLGVALDLVKKHMVFDLPNTNGRINYAIHKLNDTMDQYHLNKLHYTNSVPFATKPDGDFGGAGGKDDLEYGIAWTSKEEFFNKLDQIKSKY